MRKVTVYFSKSCNRVSLVYFLFSEPQQEATPVSRLCLGAMCPH